MEELFPLVGSEEIAAFQDGAEDRSRDIFRRLCWMVS